MGTCIVHGVASATGLTPIVAGYQDLGTADDFSIADEGGRATEPLIVGADDALRYLVLAGKGGDLAVKSFRTTVYPSSIGKLRGDLGKFCYISGSIAMTGKCNVHSHIVAHTGTLVNSF